MTHHPNMTDTEFEQYLATLDDSHLDEEIIDYFIDHEILGKPYVGRPPESTKKKWRNALVRKKRKKLTAEKRALETRRA